MGEFEQGRDTSELNYKELQEKGVFDLPYKAFQFMQSQQSKIEQLEKKLKAVEEIMNDYYTGSFDESAEMAGLISLALSGECDE